MLCLLYLGSTPNLFKYIPTGSPSVPSPNASPPGCAGSPSATSPKGSPPGCAMQARSGPYFYNHGTLYAADKDEIFAKTGVVANIRERKQWDGQRGLTLCGPADKLAVAANLAHEMIMKSVQDDPPTQVRQERLAAAKKSKDSSDTAEGGWVKHGASS